MTVITPGGATATIQSSLLEGQFFQLIEFFQNIEATSPTSPGFFTGNLDTDSMEFSGSFKIPVIAANSTIQYTGDGSLFLVVPVFSPGVGGTFTAATAIDYFMQVLSRLIFTQNTDTANPLKKINVTAKVDLNKNTLEGNFVLPFTRTLSATGLSITPVSYLL